MGDRLVWGWAPREPALSEVEGSKPSKARQPPAAAATCAATFESNWITQELRRLAEAFDLARTMSAEASILARPLRKSGNHTGRTMGFAFHAACAPNERR